MLDWIWTHLALALGNEAIRVGIIGLTMGIAWCDFVPRMLPSNLDAGYAQRLTRLIVFGIVLTASFFLNPTPLGLVIALTAAAGAPAVQVLLLRAIYVKWPGMMPKSLQECSTDRPPPPSLVKKEPPAC